MRARVHVTLKRGVLDPQGQAIAHALRGLGFDSVGEVRQGKFIEIELEGATPAAAKQQVEAMCQKLLANPVIENYAVDLSQ
jgi:phosphoribosylformylglycinamidine synthase subunit PurS